MSSPVNEPGASEYLRDFPSAGRRRLPLWPDPVEPGFYGVVWSQTVLLTIDHRPTLKRIGESAEQASKTVLALPAGGLPPETAAAFGLVQARQAAAALGRYPEKVDAGRLEVPAELASALGWADGTRVGGWKVARLPGDGLSPSGQAGLQPEKHPGRADLPAARLRLAGGLTLWLGQALLFAIPLLVFGWQAALAGLGALLACTLLLALAWPVLPGPGWERGLVAGAVLALAYALLGWLAAGLSVGQLWGPVAAIWLAGAWMGLVLWGARR